MSTMNGIKFSKHLKGLGYKVRILIDDGMQINVGTGIGKYSLYLYNELKRVLPSCDSVELSQFTSECSGKKAGRLKYLFYINSKDFLDKCKDKEIVHFTNYAMPIRRNKNTKYIVTIHDLASFLYPKTLPLIYAIYNRWCIQYAIRHSDAILTVSNSVKEEIVHRFPKISNKVRVAYPGVYEEFSKNKKPLTETYESKLLRNLKANKFFLFIGTIEKRKNLAILIDSFIKLKHSGKGKDYKLVLAGRFGVGFEDYMDIINKSDCSDDIITTGYISSDDCIRLYQNAAAYVFPTVYEGFGSTQLECMINHLPLICSSIPTNKEVSGKYSLFFDLSDTSSLVRKMEQIVFNKYDYLSKAIIADETIQKFLWENVISDYIAVYKKVLTN